MLLEQSNLREGFDFNKKKLSKNTGLERSNRESYMHGIADWEKQFARKF